MYLLLLLLCFFLLLLLFFFFFGGGEHTHFGPFCPNHLSMPRIPSSPANLAQRRKGGGGGWKGTRALCFPFPRVEVPEDKH